RFVRVRTVEPKWGRFRMGWEAIVALSCRRSPAGMGPDHMRRRDFVRGCVAAAATAAWPLALRARTAEAARIGFIGSELRLKQFRQGLQELSLREGRDLVIAYRPNDPTEALPRVVAELLALKVDVIVASGSLAVDAARKATRTIPIVM